MMFDELIKRLRETSIDFGESDHVSVMLIEAADAIEELQKQLNNGEIENIKLKEEFAKYRGKNRWIPVTERLPEKDQTVLAYCAEDNFCYISRMHQSFEDYDVTHWIPLPQMPESEGERWSSQML